MAASTMAPTAMAMPPSDMMFALTPISRMGINEITIATGMVSTGMTALGTCQRKIKITSETMISSSTSVCFRLSMERRISSDRS